MQKIAAVFSVVLLLAMSYAIEAADEQQASPAANVQIVSSPSDVKWGPAPPVVAKGAQAAVLETKKTTQEAVISFATTGTYG